MKRNVLMSYPTVGDVSKKIKPVLFLITVFILSIPASFAQEKISIIKLSPQHFIASTLKVDFETSLRPHSSFIISPSMTAFDKGNEKVMGGGMELAKRFYVMNSEPSSLSGFYANVGLSYNYYDVWYKKRDETQSSYYYYNYQDTTKYIEYKEKIHKVGGDFVFGYQVAIKEVFFVDMYFGGGLRIGVSSRGNDSDYSSMALDYAYNGIVPKVGIKAGLKIR